MTDTGPGSEWWRAEQTDQTDLSTAGLRRKIRVLILHSEILNQDSEGSGLATWCVKKCLGGEMAGEERQKGGKGGKVFNVTAGRRLTDIDFQ